MTFIEDIQPLIDWCTQPHPQDHPRLQRVASAVLSHWWLDREGFECQIEAEYFGPLVYWPMRGRHFHGGFSGALPAVSHVTTGQLAHVWFTLAEDRPWIGIQGPGIGDEWSEDVHLEPENYVAFGKKPEDVVVWMGFYAGAIQKFNLALRPSYLYGG